jgi:hypothetical protein
MLGGRVLHYSVDDAGPVEPGYNGEPAGHGGGLEPADLLHPPDVQLQVRPPGGQRVQAALRAPGQVAAQVGFGVRAGGALEAGQVGSYCQSQPVGERLRKIAGRWGQLGEGHHSPTLRRLPIIVEVTKRAPGGMCGHPERHYTALPARLSRSWRDIDPGCEHYFPPVRVLVGDTAVGLPVADLGNRAGTRSGEPGLHLLP